MAESLQRGNDSKQQIVLTTNFPKRLTLSKCLKGFFSSIFGGFDSEVLLSMCETINYRVKLLSRRDYIKS